MRVEPVAPSHPSPPPPAARPRPTAVAPAAAASDKDAGADTGTPSVDNGRRVASQMVQWSPGVTVLRVLDTYTGEVLMQTPPEQVLHLVEGVVREMRERVLGHAND